MLDVKTVQIPGHASSYAFFPFSDLDGLKRPFGFAAGSDLHEQTIFNQRFTDTTAICQHERSRWTVAPQYAGAERYARLRVDLPATESQAVYPNRFIDRSCSAKTCNRQAVYAINL